MEWISFDETSKIFTLRTAHTMYQMQIQDYGYLIHLYYGPDLGDVDTSYRIIGRDRGFSPNPNEAGKDRTFSLDYLPQEFPVEGTGDFRSPMLSIRDSAGTFGCDLRYTGYEIKKGKYGLEGLPAVYSESDKDDAETLCVHLKNDRTGLVVVLMYGVLPHLDIITRSAVVTNTGRKRVTVEKLQSACLDFLYGDGPNKSHGTFPAEARVACDRQQARLFVA